MWSISGMEAGLLPVRVRSPAQRLPKLLRSHCAGEVGAMNGFKHSFRLTAVHDGGFWCNFPSRLNAKKYGKPEK